MKRVSWGSSGQNVSAIAVGCMRINRVSLEQAAKLVDTAMEKGVNFFDHADIYGGGECETIFARARELCGRKREDMFIQSKCGIVPGRMYDFSKKHILESVDGSLKRLKTDYLDALLLHRPDALCEPEEVAEAFDHLKQSGKVRYFGVSNHTPFQIELLKKWVNQPIMANQMQFGPAHASMIRSGLEANMMSDGAVDRDGGVLDYCRLHDITIQAWSPFQYGMFEGVFLNSEKYTALNETLRKLAKKYEVSDTVITVAWILRHPANMQVLSGTMTLSRFEDICRASDIGLTREEWYEIYLAAGNILP
ncbi:MAG: aldo/keto reductase family oxidoreductase [Hungatella sp.]|nr:aldo/keto reductase family oxidoreductase [Hungatella sp.]